MLGTIGTGPPLYQVGVGICTVDTAHNRLVISASSPDATPPYGALLGVDLTTGNRTLISGGWADPRTGAFSQGSGPPITYASAVRVAADGSYVVATMVVTGTGNAAKNVTQLVGVDPVSGARTVIFDASTHTAANDPCTGLSTSRFALGADGTAYFTRPFVHAHEVVAEKNNVCHDVLCSSCTPPLGTGPDFDNNIIADTQLGPDGNVWMLTNFGSVIRLDPTTETYVRFSSSDTSALVGTGPGLPIADLLTPAVMTFFNGSLYALGRDPSPLNVRGYGGGVQVDLTTGNRTQLQLAGFVFIDVECWAPVPGKPYIAAVAGDQAIGLYEPSSGNAVILSN
jgi:hypothetical protein